MSTASTGNRSRALKCRHFCNPWDLHNYCATCRESSKGDDYCVTGKGKCMVCASFTEEQKQKIINRKRYVKKIRLGYPTSPKMNPSSWESRIRVIFLKVPSKSSNRQLKAFINPHPNPAMSCWEIPEPECWD